MYTQRSVNEFESALDIAQII